jgi:hypothetical protein
MARKLFNPKPDTHWAIGMGGASGRPVQLLLIGECATIWPFVEHQMAICLGILLGSTTDAAMAVFSSIRQGRGQRDAITAAASVTRTEEDQMLIAACLSLLKTAESARNDVVHGQWGVSDTLPNALLWIEAKHHANWNAAAIIKAPGEGPSHDELAKHFFVYTSADLIEVRDLLRVAWRTAFDLSLYLKWAQGEPDTLDLIRARLLAVPQVAQALDHLKKRKSTT